jgi:hypothetical protein
VLEKGCIGKDLCGRIREHETTVQRKEFKNGVGEREGSKIELCNLV